MFIFLILGSWATLFAQEPLRYTTKQGLPSNHIYDLAEDENGFMWFATKQGLVKYDGETFKTLTIKDGLPNNDTWLLELDYQGHLWFFSKSKYQGYVKNDSIHTFATKNKEVITPRFIYKTKTSFSFYDDFGMKTFDNKNIINFDLYNKSSYKIVNLKLLEIQKKYGFNDEYRMPIFLNPVTKETLFFQNKKILIYDWNFNFKKEVELDITFDYQNNNLNNQGLLYNQIGFYTLKEGILFIDFKDYTTQYKSFKDLVDLDEVKNVRCFSTKNNIQISIPGHLMIFDYNLILQNTYNLPYHLSNKSFKDSSGNIWMTDLGNGISLLPKTFVQSEYYLRNQKVQKINKLKNQLFAGVNDKGFFQYNHLNNHFAQLTTQNSVNGEIYQIKEESSSNRNYYISSSHYYEFQNSKLNSFYIKDYSNSTVNLGGVKDITLFKNNHYIISTSGLIIGSINTDNTELLIEKNGLLFTEPFKNHIYAAGSDGLHKLDNKNLVKPILNKSILEVPISSLKSSDEYLIVGTDGRGVYLYDSKNIYHLKETDGLSVQRILKKGDKLWLATQIGVYVVQLKKNNLIISNIINAFYDTDGLLQNNTNDIYLENDFLYAATDTGLAKLNIQNPIYKQSPNLYFKTVNDTLSFQKKDSKNIAISFSCLDYNNQEYLNYSYRLLPTQNDWVNTSTKTLIFSNLNPNLYTLEVRVIDQHNNITTKSLYLNVVPEWWQTTWALILFVFLALLILFGLYKILKYQIQKKEEAKAQQDKRIAGLELQALRSQMNPHFVHNSLNAIQYFIQRNEVELSENYLSKFSQLIRLFFEYSRRQNITIKEELDLLRNYLEIEKLRFEEKLNYTISVCDIFDVEEQLIPSMLLQPIVENAVNHGIFHKKENGNISVTFKYINDTTFKVVIEDDGIGINNSKKLFKASSKNYQSNSSKVLQERIILLNQSKDWGIEFNALDKSELNSSLTGTIITLLFKQNLKL